MSKGLQERILRELKAMNGKVGFYYKNLVTGETFGYHENEQFLPASIVKLPLLAAMLMMRERGETDFGEMITIRKDQKLPGCGVVQHMTGDQNGQFHASRRFETRRKQADTYFIRRGSTNLDEWKL